MRSFVSAKTKVALALTNSFVCSTAFAWETIISQEIDKIAICVAPLKESPNQGHANPNSMCLTPESYYTAPVKVPGRTKISDESRCDLRVKIVSKTGSEALVYPNSINVKKSPFPRIIERFEIDFEHPISGIGMDMRLSAQTSTPGMGPLAIAIMPTAKKYEEIFQKQFWDNEHKRMEKVLGIPLNRAMFPIHFYDKANSVGKAIEEGKNKSGQPQFAQDNQPQFVKFWGMRRDTLDIVSNAISSLAIQEQCSDSE